MKTKIVTLEAIERDDSILKEAGRIIRNGGLVAFPTETVYGLGGDALNKESSRKIYAAKGRPSDNPLIVHISNMNDLRLIVKEVSQEVIKLAQIFWPGPLTMIMKKSDLVPKETTGGLPTVAVRMPSHPIALELIRQAGGYIAAPSANLSGKPSSTKAKHVIEDLKGKIDMIIDGEGIDIGLESTIIDMTETIPMILRPGFITADMLQDVLGRVETDKTILDRNCTDKPKAPGMRYRHYAPGGQLTIIEGEEKEVIEVINRLSREGKEKGKKVGVIGTQETRSFYVADSVKNAGKRADKASIARRLYDILREFDEEKIEMIYSESFAEDGVGQAIMNRLLKASGYSIITVNDVKD